MRKGTIGGMAAAAAMMAGCSTGSPDVATHYVFGFGKVSVTKESGVAVVDRSTIGVHVSDCPAWKVDMGYSSELTSFLDPRKDAVLEVRSGPFGNVTIKTQREGDLK